MTGVRTVSSAVPVVYTGGGPLPGGVVVFGRKKAKDVLQGAAGEAIGGRLYGLATDSVLRSSYRFQNCVFVRPVNRQAVSRG